MTDSLERAVKVGGQLAVVVGVLDARAMVERMQAEMTVRGLGCRFERELAGVEALDGYGFGLRFVERQAGPWLVHALVREAVLDTRRPGAPREFEGDGEPRHWNLPRELVGLARRLVEHPMVFGGPVLTTSFDPLLSLAIEHAGGVVDHRFALPNGRLVPAGPHRAGILVVHLRGYWRGEVRPRPPHGGPDSWDELVVSQMRGRNILAVGHRDAALLEQLREWGATVFEVDALALDRAESLGRPKSIINEQTGIELVHIPSGSFLMGSADDEEGRHEDEGPQHEVELADFYLARTPVTNAQYQRFLAAHPEAPKPEFWDDPKFNQPEQPVVGVSWEDAQKFCEWAKLKLPTEAQWEYACRAGTTTAYWSGDDEAALARVGWYGGNSGDQTHPVAEKDPNPFGLYDMHGNVWELCQDNYGPYAASPPRPGDGLHEQVGDANRVLRGGSWFDVAGLARSAYRGRWHPSLRYDYVGFRPAQGHP